MLAQNHFKAKTSDIFLATFPRSGTTWLKALLFALTTRNQFDLSAHPLRFTGPHDCVPFIEVFDYHNYSFLDIKTRFSPRLLATHLPYALLPKSVTASGCRIVYICRNPKDVLVSLWHFYKEVRLKELPPLTLDEAFELFCRGILYYGPIWDHVLGYYKASLESPDKILFLKYEDMKREPISYVKKIGMFIGKPFTLEEERDGTVEKIVRLCSFDGLSNLEANKSGVHQFSSEFKVENRSFFRKGQVGDWKNYLTVEMIRRLDQIIEEKFGGSGLSFEDQIGC